MARADSWNGYGCGDGEYVPIDWSDARIFYGCSQYGACRRYDGQRTARSPARTSRTAPTSVRWNWHAPLVIDPNDPAIIYFAGNQLNRSTDRGDTWSAISPPHRTT